MVGGAYSINDVHVIDGSLLQGVMTASTGIHKYTAKLAFMHSLGGIHLEDTATGHQVQ